MLITMVLGQFDEAPVITIRHGNERGHANYGWLDTYHTLSFDTYYDRAYLGLDGLGENSDHSLIELQGIL